MFQKKLDHSPVPATGLQRNRARGARRNPFPPIDRMGFMGCPVPGKARSWAFQRQLCWKDRAVARKRWRGPKVLERRRWPTMRARKVNWKSGFSCFRRPLDEPRGGHASSPSVGPDGMGAWNFYKPASATRAAAHLSGIYYLGPPLPAWPLLSPHICLFTLDRRAPK